MTCLLRLRSPRHRPRSRSREDKAGAGVGGPGDEDRVGLGVAVPHDHRHARLDDAGLLSGNFGKSIPQQGAVIEPDAGNYAKLGSNDIGAVKPPAEAHLNDRPVDTAVSEPFEGHSGGNLKEGKRKSFEVGAVPLYEVKDIIFRHHRYRRRAVLYPHPLSEIKDMRRSVKSCFIAGCSQVRCKHIRHGTLAVRSGNMNSLEGSGGMSEQLVKSHHPIETRLVSVAERNILNGRETLEKRLHFHLI